MIHLCHSSKLSKNIAVFFITAAAAFIFPGDAGCTGINSILERAISLQGTPYRHGGAAPGGFDCSGFIYYLYKPLLPDLPRVSREMAKTGVPVEYGKWEKGDLLFFATGTNPETINHVAVYLGNGMIIHSISNGPETGVVSSPLNAKYWKFRYVTARRVMPEQQVSDEEGISVENSKTKETENKGTSQPGSIKPRNPEKSPWNTFDGYLQGDFESWKNEEEKAFQEYKENNG